MRMGVHQHPQKGKKTQKLMCVLEEDDIIHLELNEGGSVWVHEESGRITVFRDEPKKLMARRRTPTFTSTRAAQLPISMEGITRRSQHVRAVPTMHRAYRGGQRTVAAELPDVFVRGALTGKRRKKK